MAYIAYIPLTKMLDKFRDRFRELYSKCFRYKYVVQPEFFAICSNTGRHSEIIKITLGFMPSTCGNDHVDRRITHCILKCVCIPFKETYASSSI